MRFDPAAIRFAVELLGAEHVLLGSDWPIMPITPRKQIEEILTSLDFSDEQKSAIMSGNALRLLTPRTTTSG
jgi:predicted TIM-barrel fold metal-dependent hydrolase